MKALLILILTIAALSMVSCEDNSEKSKSAEDVHISSNDLDTNRYAIILKDTLVEVTKNDLRLIYSVIRKVVDSVSVRRGSNVDITHYNFQVVPLKSLNKQKLFWINAFCNGGSSDWRKELYQIKDGGKCFFNTTINLSTLGYSNLIINGEA